MPNQITVRAVCTTSWKLVKTRALGTMGLFPESMDEPSDGWKRWMLSAEHSPIRSLRFDLYIRLPSWVSVHFSRHKIGVEHWISTQRPERTRKAVKRGELSQGEMVDHTMEINAAELIFMARRRLCSCSADTTRSVMETIRERVRAIDPIMAEAMVVECEYRGGRCPERKSCGKYPQIPGIE